MYLNLLYLDNKIVFNNLTSDGLFSHAGLLYPQVLTTLWILTSIRMQLLWNCCLLGNQSQKIIALRRIVCINICRARASVMESERRLLESKHNSVQINTPREKRHNWQLPLMIQKRHWERASGVIELLLNKWPKDKQWVPKLAGGCKHLSKYQFLRHFSQACPYNTNTDWAMKSTEQCKMRFICL